MLSWLYRWRLPQSELEAALALSGGSVEETAQGIIVNEMLFISQYHPCRCGGRAE